jgi:hypothetical protein
MVVTDKIEFHVPHLTSGGFCLASRLLKAFFSKKHTKKESCSPISNSGISEKKIGHLSNHETPHMPDALVGRICYTRIANRYKSEIG